MVPLILFERQLAIDNWIDLMHKARIARGAEAPPKPDHANRYDLIPPHETLHRLGLAEGMTFVDIGCGMGYFSRSARIIVGESGRVLAFDYSERAVQFFRKEASAMKIELCRNDIYTVPMESHRADFVLLAFVLHETKEPARLIAEAKRLLAPNGRIAIIEWKKRKEEIGPEIGERLSQTILREAVTGCEIIEEGELNASHYFFLVR